jgi:electron transport complex protein RnfG
MKKDFALPIIVLTVICLVISLALAVTNSVTTPIIADAASGRAETARREIIPDAQGFVQLDLTELPPAVTEAYASTNDVGYVFMLSAIGGYNGDGSIQLIIGIDPSGKIIAIKSLANNETKGLGSRVSEPDFIGQFTGLDATLAGANAVSGATYSSKAFLSAVGDAFSAFESAKEAGL